jgi:hypothetical protein
MPANETGKNPTSSCDFELRMSKRSPAANPLYPAVERRLASRAEVRRTAAGRLVAVIDYGDGPFNRHSAGAISEILGFLN